MRKSSAITVLWVCNVPLPCIANHLNIAEPNVGGWLVGYANSVQHNPEIELHVCFPMVGLKRAIHSETEGLFYHAFSQPKQFGVLSIGDQLKSTPVMEAQIKDILNLVKPDLLHVFGTEYRHAVMAIKLFDRPERTLISIQGLTHYYAKHFCLGLDWKDRHCLSASSIIRGSVSSGRKKLEKCGKYECEAIKLTGSVIGRTDWDRACCMEINPSAKYYHCNESLRPSFYSGVWSYSDCNKHSIFMSQASSPIKGLQYAIEALPEVLKQYPDTVLRIAGNNILADETLWEKLKQSPFGRVMKKKIDKLEVANNVLFLGPLNETEMREEYLKSNVFLSASVIENSPNSLGEAMILGVPCVVSDVGGVKNMIKHESEGYVYQSDAPYMAAYYIKKIFSDGSGVEEMGKAARLHAQQTHNRDNNGSRLANIYENVLRLSKEVTG